MWGNCTTTRDCLQGLFSSPFMNMLSYIYFNNVRQSESSKVSYTINNTKCKTLTNFVLFMKDRRLESSPKSGVKGNRHKGFSVSISLSLS